MAIKELKTESTKAFKTKSELLSKAVIIQWEISKKKKDSSLFATKLIEEITDTANYKRYNL